MVEPISDEERSAFYRKVKIGLSVLVGLSGGLITSQTDATLLQTGLAVVAGLALGAVLAWFIVPSEPVARRRQSERDDRRERTFADGNGEKERESRRRR